MTIVITREEKDRIKFKGSDGTCSVMVDDKEVDGLIVGISTRGTYTIKSLDEVGSLPEDDKPYLKKDQAQRVMDTSLE